MNLSIKNVPEPLVQQLRARAKRNHRSLQGELLAILEETAAPRGLTLDEAYERIRALGLHTEPDSIDILREERDAR